MSRFSQDLRRIERRIARLTGGPAKAAQFRRNLEKKVRQSVAQSEPKIIQSLVKSGRAGWANDPDRLGAVLVERNTGCVLLDSKGRVIRGSKVPSSPAAPVDKGVFLQHLKHVEGFASHMYKDMANNVTIGIGHKLDSPEEAKTLTFFERGTNRKAHDKHVENAFDKVKNSNIDPGKGAAAFRNLTNIEISAVEGVTRALDAMDEFLRLIVGSSSFPEFDSYPVSAKMGLLDVVYTTGVIGTKTGFPKFTAAVRRRNWMLAARESHRPTSSPDRNQIVRKWFEQAARLERFFIDPACRPKRINIQIR